MSRHSERTRLVKTVMPLQHYPSDPPMGSGLCECKTEDLLYKGRKVARAWRRSQRCPVHCDEVDRLPSWFDSHGEHRR